LKYKIKILYSSYLMILTCKLMNKKELLIKILTHLEPVRELASWLKILVDKWQLWDESENIIINAVKWAIETAKSSEDKNKLQKGLKALQKLEEIEFVNKQQDEKDLEELDGIIDSL